MQARLGMEKRQLISGLELLIASTEVALLTQFPGSRDLVRAALSPSRLRPSARPSANDTDSPNV
jgi:hypothetical protein